jgi:hypothetical protein
MQQQYQRLDRGCDLTRRVFGVVGLSKGRKRRL